MYIYSFRAPRWWLVFCFPQIYVHERKKSQQEQINEMPLYPTEDIIWDENIVPTEYYSGEGKALVKMYVLSLLTKFLWKWICVYFFWKFALWLDIKNLTLEIRRKSKVLKW